MNLQHADLRFSHAFRRLADFDLLPSRGGGGGGGLGGGGGGL